MKKPIRTFFILTSLMFSSCTDVIDVELQTEPPRLVIEASIDWTKGTIGQNQLIKLSLSSAYFDTLTETQVTGATVKITNDINGTTFIFTDQNNGNYTTDQFIPELDHSYTLEIAYDGEIYLAKEVMTPVVDISSINQSTDHGFIDDVIGVSVSFIDPEGVNNYYLVKFQEQKELFPTLFDVDDEFTDGNEMHITYEKSADDETGQEEIMPGDVLDINLYGISESYYNYIRLLIHQSDTGGSPFSSIPAPLKGNCINPENPDRYAYGYFRLTQVDSTIYTVE